MGAFPGAVFPMYIFMLSILDGCKVSGNPGVIRNANGFEYQSVPYSPHFHAFFVSE